MNDVTKDLLVALKGVMPYVVTQVVACNGLRCRENVCESCTLDAQENVDKACAAYQTASEAISRAEAALAAPQPEADGWIPWAGGECPVDPEAYVQVRYADGVIGDELQEAEYFNWEHSDSPGSSVFNISAYRVFVPRK